MPEGNYSFPDKLGYGETIMFHIRCMSSEMAADGLDNEFEDTVDMLGWMVWPYMTERAKADWTIAASDGVTLKRTDDPLKWGQAKRRRVEAKMIIAMETMETNGLLLKKVREFEPEFHYQEIPVEGGKG